VVRVQRSATWFAARVTSSSPDGPGTLAERFRRHAELCSSPLYVVLLRAMADDWDAGGVVSRVCADWAQAPPGAVVQLRLLAGLHRLVLRREAPLLATYYPSVGGTAAPSSVWPVARSVIEQHEAELRDGLAVPPQTNEVGRSCGLLVGLLDAVWRSGFERVRLLEPGASAGLNLRLDSYLVGGRGWSVGPQTAVLQLDDAVAGPVTPHTFTVVERRGCDLAPVDPSTEAGRLLLTSYVWPEHLDRFERLRAALDVAQRVPAVVEAAPAADWLGRVLSEPVADDVLTVVQHSVTRQYWPPAESARVEELLSDAGRRLPALAHVALEHDGGPALALDVRVWAGGVPDRRRTAVATTGSHGVPVDLLPGVVVGPPTAW
jgi:hypothetical protein